MALVANGVPARQAPYLPHRLCPMWVVAVHALYQSLVDAVVIRFGKVCLGGGVASVTQLGLLPDEQELFFPRVMRRVAVEASHIATGVGGFGEMRLLVSFAMTA